MQHKDRKRWKPDLLIWIFLLPGLSLLLFWNVFLFKEIRDSKEAKTELRKQIEKIEILEKTDRNFMKDYLKQKTIALCFLEVIEDYGEYFSFKEKQDCIQLIVITDEKYGERGLDAPLILAWIEKESGGNPKGVSSSGAKGLTQWFDYRAWNILREMGYPGYDQDLVFNPVINLAGGIYYLESLIKFWEWKGLKNQNIVLSHGLHSYRWGTERTEQLFNSGQESKKQFAEYADWILNRREFWAKKMKYWLDDARELAEKVK